MPVQMALSSDAPAHCRYTSHWYLRRSLAVADLQLVFAETVFEGTSLSLAAGRRHSADHLWGDLCVAEASPSYRCFNLGKSPAQVS